LTEDTTLGGIDLGIIGAYFALTVVVGVVLAKRASKGMEDYFLGGRKIPWWVLGASGSASNFDMTGTMVITSFFFALGFQGFWVASRGGLVLGLVVLLAFMGKWLRRSRVITTAEWMALRFGEGPSGKAARILAATANLVSTVGMVIYFAKGTGLFVSTYLPFSPEVCALGMIAIGLVYTVLSGMWGVVYTDIFQEVMLFGAAIFIMGKAFFLPNHADVIASAGEGFTDIMPRWEAAPMEWLGNPEIYHPEIYHLFGLCVIFWISKAILEGLSGTGGGYMAQRYYAAPDERSAGLMTAEWAGLLSMRWGMVAGLAVLGLALAMNDASVKAVLDNNPERTLPLVLNHVLPAGIKGLALAGLIAAAMSTFDSTINGGAAYWVNDIYKTFIRPKATEKQLVRQSYIATILIAVFGVVLAMGIKNINEIWNWITGPLWAGLFSPLVLRWYWWRFNGWGFSISTGAGLLVAVILAVVAPDMAFYISFPIISLLGLVVGVLVSLGTQPTDRKVLERFYARIRPWGFWSDLRQSLSESVQAESRRENNIDRLIMIVAFFWQMSLFAGAVLLIMHQFLAFAACAIIVVVTSLLLYKFWYKRLARAGVTTGESA
jgi:Na+/proline symporter